MSDTLDTLLTSPLDEPADNGFSARVMATVVELRLHQARREAVLSLVVVALLVAIGLASPVGAEITHVAELLVATPAFWLGGLMLALSGVVYGRVRA